MEQILLSHWRAPGDIVCMTACVRDLMLSYPGRYEIHIAGSCPELWENNPYIVGAWGSRPPRGMPRYRLSCRDALMESSGKRLHYLTAFHRDLERQLGVSVPTLYAKGDLHLSEAEKSKPLVEGPYWLIVAGGKNDIPAKIWSTTRFQQVVARLRDEGIRCVQGGAQLPGHWNPELEDVENYVGKTDLRGFLRLIYGAEGVVCPVSFPMHAAAAFDKPCVVIAGGREPWWWEAYTNTSLRQFGGECAPVSVPHHYLHSIGQLECCQSTGCWKTHVVGEEFEDGDVVCQLPVDDTFGQTIPRCLYEITGSDVVAAVVASTKDSARSSNGGKHDSMVGDIG